MPGSQVRDALAPALHTGVTLNAAGSTNGTAIQVDKPQQVRVIVTYPATVTGTTPTADIEIQASNDSTFSTGVVSEGRFKQGSGGSQANVVAVLETRITKRYARAVVTLGGTTPVYTGLTIFVHEDSYKVQDTDSA